MEKKQSAISVQQRITNQANTLEDYRQRILNLQAKVNARDATIAAQEAQIAELRRVIAEVKPLISPSRSGGVSRYELEAAERLLAQPRSDKAGGEA